VKIHDRQGADLIDAWSSIKNCTKCIPAAAYVGKTIVFSAAVRVETRAEQDRAQLWLRVDLEGGRSGFFDNGGQNPIVSGEWQRYQIAGDVSEDAERICLGFMVFGGATAWIDEVRIEQATSSPEYDAG
jgi:hypothetical protein